MPVNVNLPQFNEILQSIFCISVLNESGTCFVCRLNANQIIVITCKHIFTNANDGDIVNFEFVRYDNQFDNFSGILLCSKMDHSDICAIIVDDSKFQCSVLFQSLKVPSRVFIGDEVFVLGFPFIMNNNTFQSEPIFIGNIFYPQAILRHGYVASASVSDHGSKRILLDLHNNPGFSGGPIIKKGHLTGTMNFGYIPIGVMSGYYYDKVNGKINSDTNSGISYGCSYDIIWRRIMEYEYNGK